MKILQGLTTAGLPLLFWGCLNDAAPPAPAGRGDGMTINNDRSTLNARFSRRNEPVRIENAEGALGKGAAYDRIVMTLVAEIDPPLLNGAALQATSVSLDDGYAYISYNTAGEAYGGGVDVVRIRSGHDYEIVSSALYENADVHALHYADGELYLAEASGEADAASPAMLEKMRVANGELQAAVRERAPLGSFAATSVAVSGERIFATSGNTGGLQALSRETLLGGAAVAADDARWVDVDAARVVVAQGMPGRVAVYDKETLALAHQWPFAGADVPQAKTTVRVVGGKALIAAGTGGVQLMNLETGKIVGSVSLARMRGSNADEEVVNAADGAGDLIYASNGAGGVHAIEVEGKLEDSTGDREVTLKPLGKLVFEGLESVNHIAFDGDLLVIVTGRGGVKIVRVEAVPRVQVTGTFNPVIE